MADLWVYEKRAWENGFTRVVGVDEVGRGPLAGPVVAAAVVLPRDFGCEGIRDSKALTPKSRETAYDRIAQNALSIGIGIISPEIIDKINILQATHAAMKAALTQMGAVFDFILVDGLPVRNLPTESLAIIKGDTLSVSICAASIIAKVTRDRIMLQIDQEYPQYGFANHKGYSSSEHIAAIKAHGPCPYHRMTFARVRERIENCCLPGLE